MKWVKKIVKIKPRSLQYHFLEGKYQHNLVIQRETEKKPDGMSEKEPISLNSVQKVNLWNLLLV